MKKLLGLVLVLAMASLANATYIINFDAVASTITVSSDEPLVGGIDMGLAVIGDATIGDIVYRTVDAPVATPVVTGYSAEDLLAAGAPFDTKGWSSWTTVTWGDAGLTANGIGMWFTATVTGAPGAQILLTDNAGTELGGNTVIPEPATMVILALGGLLLRKKA